MGIVDKLRTNFGTIKGKGEAFVEKLDTLIHGSDYVEPVGIFRDINKNIDGMDMAQVYLAKLFESCKDKVQPKLQLDSNGVNEVVNSCVHQEISVKGDSAFLYYGSTDIFYEGNVDGFHSRVTIMPNEISYRQTSVGGLLKGKKNQVYRLEKGKEPVVSALLKPNYTTINSNVIPDRNIEQIAEEGIMAFAVSVDNAVKESPRFVKMASKVLVSQKQFGLSEEEVEETVEGFYEKVVSPSMEQSTEVNEEGIEETVLNSEDAAQPQKYVNENDTIKAVNTQQEAQADITPVE